MQDDAGRAAATWALVIRASAGCPEIYLICRRLGGVLKTSLHGSGVWRHAYVKQSFERIFDGVEDAPEDRCIEEWQRPAEHGPGVTWALQILVPPGGARTPAEPNTTPITWIRAARAPRWNVINIFLLADRALLAV